MTPPGTFDRVYSAIRERLRAGSYRPGTRLEPAALAGELNASVTPVRDALHRLTGERLVDAPRHEGFRVPMMTEPLLRNLYAWHLDLLLLAVASHRSGIAEGEQGAGAAGGAEESLSGTLMQLVQSTGNPEHAAALGAVTDRLEPAQRLEQSLLDGLQAETDEIVGALRASDHRRLRRSLTRYHRRRDRIVPQLLAALLAAR